MQVSAAPTLSGERIAEARGLVARIADDLSSAVRTRIRDPFAPGDPTLSDGAAGISLFLTRASSALGVADYQEASEEYRACAETAMTELDLSFGLYGGFTGIAWLRHHRDAEVLGTTLTAQDDACQAVDEVLLDYFANETAWVPFDLMQGSAGVALYALARRHTDAGAQLLHEALRQLQRGMTSYPRGGAWHVRLADAPDFYEETYPEGTVPIGLAHGVAGVVAVLARIVREAADVVSAGKLLEECLAFLRSSRLPQSATATGSFTRLATPSGPIGEHGEFTWCWGDAGVSAALLSASRALDDPSLERDALQVMRPYTMRAPHGGEWADASLCHGWSTMVLSLARMYQVSRDPAFAAAADRWARPILESAVHPHCIGGLKFRIARLGKGVTWESSAGLLNGAAGVGLALLCATGDCTDNWDSVLGYPCLRASIGQ
jgi:lantibiotic modifying enzyme